MKAFHFRLDQALRWRATQLDLEKSRVAAAAKSLADIRQALARVRDDLSGTAAQLGPSSDGSALEILSAYTRRTRRLIDDLEKGAKRAEQDLATQTQSMLVASRKAEVIEKLKETAQAEWRGDVSRELEAFAGEAFLGRLQSNKRARSSGG